MSDPSIQFRISPVVTNTELNELIAEAWDGTHEPRDFAPVLARSLVYVCAYLDDQLIGFVNVAWDGGYHAFLLDTTVRSDLRRRGIGRELVRRAVDLAREAGAVWLHVDFEQRLTQFYRKCGFERTEAGLIRLTD
jgi:GNAT superfamily N-acetyltransferase